MEPSGSPTIAACLIVRNGAETIGRCVASVRPHVDEVCVYLGGRSTDGTPRILRRLANEPGCPLTVKAGPFRADYGWARNQAASMASSEFLLQIDDDEILQGGEHLRGTLARSRCDGMTIRDGQPGSRLGRDHA